MDKEFVRILYTVTVFIGLSQFCGEERSRSHQVLQSLLSILRQFDV